MKKVHIIFLLFFATGSAFGEGIQFGVHFDPTLVWLESFEKTKVAPEGSHLGFDFGVSADFYFAKNYAFATGVSLFNTGGKLKYINGFNLAGTDLSQNTTVTYRVQYVKIPVGLRFKTHRIGRMIYSANIGFAPMIRASGHAEIPNNDNLEIKDEIRLFNLGWRFGGLAAYSLGGDAAIFGGLSFMNSFIDMTKSGGQHTPGKITSKNLMLRVGVMF